LEEHRALPEASEPYARSLLHALWSGLSRDHQLAVDGRMRGTGKVLSYQVSRAIRMLWDSLSETGVTIAEVAHQLGMSETALRARFWAEVGATPHEHVTRLRIAEAQRRLTQTDAPITSIAFDLGFSSSQYFATFFRAHAGLTPAEYRLRQRSPRPLPVKAVPLPVGVPERNEVASP
jgi:transcriptional regulator GlxA family with amidase domain